MKIRKVFEQSESLEDIKEKIELIKLKFQDVSDEFETEYEDIFFPVSYDDEYTYEYGKDTDEDPPGLSIEVHHNFYDKCSFGDFKEFVQMVNKIDLLLNNLIDMKLIKLSNIKFEERSTASITIILKF